MLDSNAVYIYMNWAMKWLLQKYRENQSKFFAKRDLSWHVRVVVGKDEQLTFDADESTDDDNAYTYLIIVHVLDQCAQNSEFVVALLRNVLIRVKQIHSNIKFAFIRSDNSSCYHSAQTVLSLPKISYESGIQICRIDFCYPQSSKGPCNRYAAVIKSYVCCFLDEKKLCNYCSRIR